MSDATPPKLYSAREVAEILNLSLRTVRYYLAKGLIKPIKLGHKTLRISAEELTRFLTQ